MTKKEETKKVLPQRQSVHVVFFSCQNCGEEVDYIQFCPDCGKQMRVIDVVEKFGDDADEFIKKIEQRVVIHSDKEEEYPTIVEDDEPNIIIMGEDEHVDDGAVTDDVNSLDEIFPDDSEEKVISKDTQDFSDLDDIVAELDKEDDDYSLDDLGEDGLPEL